MLTYLINIKDILCYNANDEIYVTSLEVYKMQTDAYFNFILF